jgi:hypothetical protein
MPVAIVAASRNKEIEGLISRLIKDIQHSLPKEKAPEGA